MSELKPCPTNHATLYFGSGDYYVICKDCNMYWRIETPELTNLGNTFALSGEERACPSQWVSVKDRLPDERCLAYTPNNDLSILYRIIPKRLFKQSASDATHWMPLPEPPEDNE